MGDLEVPLEEATVLYLGCLWRLLSGEPQVACTPSQLLPGVHPDILRVLTAPPPARIPGGSGETVVVFFLNSTWRLAALPFKKLSLSRLYVEAVPACGHGIAACECDRE